MREIDVLHLGAPRVICCYEVDGWLVDPGPESSVSTLLEALGDERPRGLLLTHIHFDHAGAAGALVRRWPELPVYVHERGARHLHDPTRLVASARRLWPDDFDRLWGEVVPIPEANLRALAGGERIEGFRVAYTPGHAKHHVAYLHEDSGGVFSGDVAGARIGGGPIIPPTLPPDFDLEAWLASIEAIAAWRPARLHPTHFGTHDDVEAHLAVLAEALHLWVEMARHTTSEAFAAAVRRRMSEAPDPSALQHAVSPDLLWAGIERYRANRDAA